MFPSYLRNPDLPGEPFFSSAGPVGILFCHGFTATTALMRPLAQVFYAQGFTVAGLLLPGHRTTPFELNRCRWQDWVSSAEEVFRQLAAGCRTVFVGGESLGGLIALYLASVHPGIAGVLAYSPALRLHSRKSEIQIRLFGSWLPFADKPTPVPSAADALWQGYRVNALAGARELLRFQRVVHQRLSLITQPLLVVQGRFDRTVAADGPEILEKRTRSVAAEVHWMPQSGHCTTIDADREGVAQLSLDFVRRWMQVSARSTEP